MGKNAVEDVAIDEDEAVTNLTPEVELKTDEERPLSKLTAEVEFMMDVILGLKFRLAA